MVRTLILLGLVLSLLPLAAIAENKACAGITKKCTKDTTYDKAIDGTVYSCYDCTQTLCKNGDGDLISGTATTSVCTSKATTFRPLSTDDQFRGSDTLAPKPTSPKRPGRTMDPRTNVGAAPDSLAPRKARPVNFDEADALFGRRTSLQSESKDSGSRSPPAETDHRRVNHANVRDHRSQETGASEKATIILPGDLFPIPTKNKELRKHRAESTENTRDHRKLSGRTNTIVKATRKTRSEQRLQAPTELRIPSGSRTMLTIVWRDNSIEEYGVELYRSDPVAGRRDPENAWKFIGLFQARIADRVTGTGMRRDVDDGLSPGTTYCYRVRAYIGFDQSQVSGFSDVACASTSM